MPHNKSVPHDRVIQRRKSTSYRMDINPEQWRSFMEGIRNGLRVEPAARLAGLSRQTVERWLSKGETIEQLQIAVTPGSQSAQHLRFWAEYCRNKSAFEYAHLSNVNNHSVSSETPGDYRASQWLLERTRPKAYNSRFLIEKVADERTASVLQFIFAQVDSNAQGQISEALKLIPGLKLKGADLWDEETLED